MILKALHKVFPIRSCSYFIDDKVIKEKKISLCLDYHIKKCEGPCEGLVSNKNYLDMVAMAIAPTPSPRPMKPILSVVVALMDTAASSIWSVSETL